MGKFRQFFMELSARDTISAGNYSLMFLLNDIELRSLTYIKKYQHSSFGIFGRVFF